LEKIEKRYIIGELKKDLYEKYETKYSREVEDIKGILRKNRKNQLSNFEEVVEKAYQLLKT